MDSLSHYGEAIGALVLGQLVGQGSEAIAKRVELQRRKMGIDDAEENTLFDNLLDLAIETTFLVLGISLVQKSVPGVTSNLHTLTLFTLGITFSVSQRMASNVRSIVAKFTTDTPLASTSS